MAGKRSRALERSSPRKQPPVSPALRTSRRRGAATEAEIDRLTGLIYDAALDRDAWPAFLEQYAEAMGATCANTHAQNLQASTVCFMSASGIDPAALDAYAEYYISIETWRPPALSLPSGSVWTSPMLVPDRTLEHSEYYNDFLEPFDIRHICCLHVSNEHDQAAFTSAFRPKWMDDFDAEDLRLARKLFPHLRRAVQIRERLLTLETERDSLGEALERLSVGIILLDRTGRIAFANSRAREVLGERDGLATHHKTLYAAASGDTTRLQKLIASARLSAVDQAKDPGGLMAVPRPSQKRPYMVLVTPIRMPNFLGSTREPTVAVFVTDPEQSIELPGHALQRLYGLTEAEAGLAISLVKGLSLAVAAEQAGITKETARTRLKMIFSKTDTHRQAELVRVVLTTLGNVQVAG